MSKRDINSGIPQLDSHVKLSRPFNYRLHDFNISYTFTDELTVLENIYALWQKIVDVVKTFEDLEKIINAMVKFLEGEGIGQHVKHLLEIWLEDGTLEHLINEALFNSKADKEWVDERLLEKVNTSDYNHHIVDFIKEYNVKEKDITSKLQLALNENKNKCLMVRSGKYNISDILELDNIDLVFNNGCVITYDGDDKEKVVTVGDNTKIVNLNIDFRDTKSNGIFVSGDGVELDKVRVKNIKNIGIEVDFSDNLKITNCEVTNSDTRDINLVGSLRVNNSKNVVLENIKVNESKGKGLVVSRCDNVVIENLMVNGVYERQPSFYSARGKNVTLNNFVTNNSRCGVKLSRGSVNNNIKNGVINITPNEIQTDYAFIIQGSSDNVVENIKINSYDNQSALRIEDHPNPEGASSNNNIVKDCVIKGNRSAIGIYLNNRGTDGFSSSNVNISNTTVDGFDGWGVRIDNSFDITLEKLTLLNLKDTSLQMSNVRNIRLLDSDLVSHGRMYNYGGNNIIVKGCNLTTTDTNAYNVGFSKGENIIFEGNTLLGGGKGLNAVNVEDFIIRHNIVKTKPSITIPLTANTDYVSSIGNILYGEYQIDEGIKNRINVNNLSHA